MKTWEKLEASVEDAIWNRLKTQSSFRTDPLINYWLDSFEPAPSVTYSVTTLLQSKGDVFQRHAVEVNSKLLEVFRQCLAPDQRLYALDWQHQCYWFLPHTQTEIDNVAWWLIPFFPCGDFHFFLTEDFSLGTFGHPWKETLCVFGKPLLSLVQNDLPTCFQEVRRKL